MSWILRVVRVGKESQEWTLGEKQWTLREKEWRLGEKEKRTERPKREDRVPKKSKKGASLNFEEFKKNKNQRLNPD